MRSFVLPIAVLAAGAVAQAPECADGLYVVVARGTGEEEGTGVTGLIADAIVDQIEDSRVEAVDYPATFSDPDYFTSEKEGADAVQELLTEYYEACPDGKIAYLGYSQVSLAKVVHQTLRPILTLSGRTNSFGCVLWWRWRRFLGSRPIANGTCR